MILDELVLHDFGIYGGRQTLTLTPAAPDRPIVLVGGLNGGGKTTILEALQLCLFGSAAPSAHRTPGGYLEHLRRRIHRAPGVRASAIELAFRHTSNGVEQSYRVLRSWSVDGATCRETFEVLRDGRVDQLATENWAEQVEEFMPSRIASLFLFDGEKVEAYADPSEAPALVATAVHNLLGLDVIERLTADLVTLERRKRAQAGGTAASAEIDDVQARLAALRERRLSLHTSFAQGNDALDRATRELRRVEEQFRREGGELYERRAELEVNAAAWDRQVAALEADAREFASGAAPLLMVTELLRAVGARDLLERETGLSAQLATVLAQEHEALLGLPQIAALPAADLAQVGASLSDRRARHADLGCRPIHLRLSDDGRLALDGLRSGIDDLRDRAVNVVGKIREASLEASEAWRSLDAVPTAEALAQVQAYRGERRAEVERLTGARSAIEAEMAAVDRDVAQLQEREARLAESEAVERFRQQDVDRMLEHSNRVRSTLLRFREAVVARHVSRIEEFVLDSFRRLSRKLELVSGLRIDPVSYAFTLTGADGRELAPDQLSAGERQLLAVAMLWGMAKASGRPLPTVIDTPLGRLDSEHRSRLVERYFPFASHQVILLSTDEEISGRYHDALAPWIGRSYHLTYDGGERRAIVEDGYLGTGGLRRVA